MDLGQLKYFIKIVEHGSFTRAAQDCAVSQPALSQQIAKLEKELGQPLFERQGRSIQVTPAGQILKAQAETEVNRRLGEAEGKILERRRALEELERSRLKFLKAFRGLLERELRSLAGRMGIEDRVLWLGWRNDLPRLYPAMDCLALTSLDEGTPVAVLEALAAGTPVAAREVGGVGEILDGVPLGRPIRDDAPESVASSILETLEISLPRDQREAVRRAMGERYSVQGLVDATETVYRQELRNAGLL